MLITSEDLECVELHLLDRYTPSLLSVLVYGKFQLPQACVCGSHMNDTSPDRNTNPTR
jgi:hypothetical protein